MIILCMVATLALTASRVAVGASAPAAACVRAAKHVPVPPHVLVVEPRSRVAYTLVDARPPEIVVGTIALRRWGCHLVLHELGHAFDVTAMTPALRAGFARRVLGGARRWFSEGRLSPAERFAEVYALCAAGSGPGGRGWISPADLRAGCLFIRRVAARAESPRAG